jgi:hypothetical protein
MRQQAKRPFLLGVIGLIAIVVIVVVVILVSSNTSKGSSLSPAQQSAAKQQIETNWKQFFAVNTSLASREKLLQDGSQFAQPMQSEFSSIGAQSFSSTISSISFNSSVSAKVVYSIYLDHQAVLSQQQGEALLINNNWVVSDSTLCQLLSLGGSKPAACENG